MTLEGRVINASPRLVFSNEVDLYSTDIQSEKKDISRQSSTEMRFHEHKAGMRPSIVVAVRVRPLHMRETREHQQTCVATHVWEES